MKKIVITGGAGFIGSHIAERMVANYPGAQIVILDKMTYATHIGNVLPLLEKQNVRLMVGDICHMHTCSEAVAGADLVIHAAAESHVDNSFGNSLAFTKTNVTGTHCLLEACRLAKVPRIIHISTDEVYGEVHSGSVDEELQLRPTNPYSASKAAAEMILQGYLHSYKIPALIVRANNIFGIRQYPEKIIPKFTVALLAGRKLTIHGTGKNRRHYLSAHDLCDALELLIAKGKIGERYNIGTVEEYQNIEIARMLCGVFGFDPDEYITFVEDRPFNDARYAVDWKKISALGWKPKRSLKDELPAIVQWYKDNIGRYNA